jgi:hypothetical protein
MMASRRKLWRFAGRHKREDVDEVWRSRGGLPLATMIGKRFEDEAIGQNFHVPGIPVVVPGKMDRMETAEAGEQVAGA